MRYRSFCSQEKFYILRCMIYVLMWSSGHAGTPLPKKGHTPKSPALSGDAWRFSFVALVFCIFFIYRPMPPTELLASMWRKRSRNVSKRFRCGLTPLITLSGYNAKLSIFDNLDSKLFYLLS